MCTKITYSSYGSKTEIVNEQFNFNISRQSIYLHEKELSHNTSTIKNKKY